MTNADLERLQELCDKATGGPWKLRFDDSGSQYASAWVSPDDEFTFDDVDFVNAARTALPELIAEGRTI